MISDEELYEIAGEDEGSDVQFQTSIMAREILAYRKAFSEPYAYEVKGILCHTLQEAEIYVGDPEPLFVKPTTPS